MTLFTQLVAETKARLAAIEERSVLAVSAHNDLVRRVAAIESRLSTLGHRAPDGPSYIGNRIEASDRPDCTGQSDACCKHGCKCCDSNPPSGDYLSGADATNTSGKTLCACGHPWAKHLAGRVPLCDGPSISLPGDRCHCPEWRPVEDDETPAAGADEGQECPSEHCPMCSGEACLLCSAGLTNDASRPECEHDVLERHEKPAREPERRKVCGAADDEPCDASTRRAEEYAQAHPNKPAPADSDLLHDRVHRDSDSVRPAKSMKVPADSEDAEEFEVVPVDSEALAMRIAQTIEAGETHGMVAPRARAGAVMLIESDRARVRAKTIEECAKVAESQQMVDRYCGYRDGLDQAATAIRSLSSPSASEKGTKK